MHRWHPDDFGEALGEHGAGQGGFLRQRLHRPVVLRPIVDQRQRLARMRIAQTCQPAGLWGRQRCHITAQDVDEHQFAQLVEHRLAARPHLRDFRHRQFDELAEPAAVALGVAGLDSRRQRFEQKIERQRITSEIAAIVGAERTQNLVFPVTITPDRIVMESDGRAVPLTPGMAVTVEITTDSRRILEYVFSPMVEVASKDFKER
jgi:hypothetical protein